MKPPPFTYHAPRDLAAAADWRDRYGAEARILAGGQTLLPLLSLRRIRPAVLIDLNAVTELSYIRVSDDDLAIGAMTRHSTIERDSAISRRIPLLRAAVGMVAHPHVRNRGTLGGALPTLIQQANWRQ